MILRFEKKAQPLAPQSRFILRLLSGIFFGSLLVIVTLIIGIAGLTDYEHMSLVDAFANSAMIMSGVGAITPIVSNGGKIFSGIFSIIAGLAFFTIAGIVFSPIVHRLLHRFHINLDR
jgi:hypothetical protein